MHFHHLHPHLHLAGRAPEAQTAPIRFTFTEPPLPTKVFSTKPRSTVQEVQTTQEQASSTGVLLGDPVFATQSESQPSQTQQSSSDNGNSGTGSSNGNTQNNSPSPSPTQDSNNVVATTSAANAPSTTFATSTLPNSNFDDTSSSSTNGFGSQTTSASAGSSTTGSSSTSSGSSEGMSTGAKIGLAVGIIAIIGAFALFLMLFMAKKRKQREAQEKANDEKRAAEQAAAASAAAAAAKQRTSAPNAPRLSLRPVSRLVPDLMGGNRSRNRNSQGNMLTTFSETRGDRSLSPANQQQSQPRDNPFNDPVNPFNDPEKAAAIGGAAAYHQPHGQAHELEDTRSMNQSSRPGTSHSQFPGAPSPAVATGPGPDQPQGNVYRILMDFKPTMEDELELRTGQHVRLLHEYDDGWALCIKLDRSQQGVVPRTCLAAKPSKPRPAAGPNGPNGYRGPPGPQSRPITPSGPGGPRMNSPSFRPDSPANRGLDSRPQTSGSGAPRQEPSLTQGSFNQAPRPLSPGPRTPKRSESPGPYGAGGPPPPMHGDAQRQRSNSASNVTGPGPRQSPPARSNLGPGAPNGPGFAF